MARAENQAPRTASDRVRRTLIRVLVVQAIALSVLGLLQLVYTP